jgi:5-methylcytosine-specific restriction endonuclease McrA
MGDEHHKYDTSHRMSFYRAMHSVGNLALLCATCNAAKGNRVTILTAHQRRKIEAQLAAAAWPVPADPADLPPP